LVNAGGIILPGGGTLKKIAVCIISIILLSTVLLACSTPNQVVPTTQLPLTTTTSATVPSTTAPLTTEARVTRVIDGDTIDVDLNGTIYRVRYIGMDTPELNDSRPEVRELAQAASEANKRLVEGAVVRLEKDVSETDKYGRLLRYVYVGSLFVNAELVKLGYAQVATYPPDVKYEALFLSLQKEAREAGRGLWAESSPTPTPTPSPTLTQTSTPTELSLQIVSVTSPVNAGAYATLVAKTVPGANCDITVYYKSGPSTAAGLYAKTADSNGDVSWTWKVSTNTTPGSWRIVVTASLSGKTVSQTTYFTVQ
jgi:micrococcal nuclease